MGKLKSAWEIAMEKVGQVDRLSSQEIQEIKEEEKIKAILSKFFKGRITVNDLWKRLQGSSPLSLNCAQMILLNSLNFNNNPYELKLRKEGILALESLKNTPNISTLENLLHQLTLLKEEFSKTKDYMEKKAKSEIENDPQSRIKTIRQGDKIILMQLSVDEALQQNPQWKAFITQHEEKYSKKFEQIIEKIKEEMVQTA